MTAMRKAVVLLASLAAALFATVIVLLLRPSGVDLGGLNTQQALDDPDVKRAVVAALLGSNPAIFDSHPDPAVARVLSPNLRDVSFRGTLVSSNSFGMREREYALPKPAGVLRVVLLGDSYVFGQGVAAEERFGVVLEQELERRGGWTGAIECLHIGIGSWNIIAECTFVRRQLSELDPDLVVQVMVPNDLDDNAGVRGFGVRSDFDPLYPERANSRVHFTYPAEALAAEGPSYLNYGLDHESRQRAATAAAEIRELARTLERRGAVYLLLPCVSYPQLTALLTALDGGLRDEQLGFVPMEFMTDPALFVSAGDRHWNPHAHERVARYVYGLIEARGLLPALGLENWHEAELETRRLHDTVVGELPGFDPTPPAMSSRLLDVRQIHGGIDVDGNVSPYASVVLARGRGDSLRLAGDCFDRPELDGTTVRVFVEELELGHFELTAGEPLDVAWALPPELEASMYVNVRLVADDWVYTGPERRDCKSFHLELLEIR